MNPKKFRLAVLAPLALASAFAAAFSGPEAGVYHSPEGVAAALARFAADHPAIAKVRRIGKSAGGREILVLEIAAVSRPKAGAVPGGRPAVFVPANLEGAHLPGTEAALALAERLLAGHGKNPGITALLETTTVFIAPLLNPDGAASYFRPVRYEQWTNATPVDDDGDDLVDEDGPEDLDGDGLITMMRVADAEGKWLTDLKDPRLMRLADARKGEKGAYALHPEGVDNDGDGAYGEDPPGGVGLNRNLPHDFEHDCPAAGRWPASEPETLALLEFLVAKPDIALVLGFSAENTFLNMRQTGQARAGGDRVRVPRRYAGSLGLDPDTDYSLREIADILKAMNFGGGTEVDEGMVAAFLGLGPALTLDPKDIPFLEAVQKEYTEGLKAAGLEILEKRAKGAGKGSFAAYAYFQYGVPVFFSDLWAVPEPRKTEPKEAKIPAKLKGMALGDEHPDAYLAGWSDSALGGRGFVNWKAFRHPDLGQVEIGGFVPFLKTVPPVADLDKTLAFHTDFYLGLMGRLAALEVREARAEPIGPGVYKVTAVVANPGRFPTSTAQGRRARTAWPIRIEVVTGAGQSLFSGLPLTVIPSLEAGGTKKLEWTVRGPKGSRLTVSARSPRLVPAAAGIVLD